MTTGKVNSILEKMRDKYNLSDNNGLLKTYVIGLVSGHDRRKIYKRLSAILAQQKHSTNIKITHRTKMGDGTFRVTEIKYTVNMPENKAYGLEGLFLYDSHRSPEEALNSFSTCRSINYVPRITNHNVARTVEMQKTKREKSITFVSFSEVK